MAESAALILPRVPWRLSHEAGAPIRDAIIRAAANRYEKHNYKKD